jgi:hypothetical protein
LACVLSTSTQGASGAEILRSSFGFQGMLQEAGQGITGRHDFRFERWGTPVDGTAPVAAVTNRGVSVQDGAFSTVVDFGPGAFRSGARWLAVGVRLGGTPAFTSLGPRQEIEAVPLALHANTAASAGYAELSSLAVAVHPDFWREPVNTRRMVEELNASAEGVRWSWKLLPLEAGDHIRLSARPMGSDTVLTVSVTNVLSSLPTSRTLWVDASDGDDSKALIGRQDRPFRSLAAACAHLTDDCSVRIRPGVYFVGPGPQKDVPPYNAALVIEGRMGVAFVGEGPGVVIQATGEGNIFLLRNTTNVLLERLTVRGTVANRHGEDGRYYALVLCDGRNRLLRVAHCTFQNSGDQAIAHLYGPRTTYDWDISHNAFENIGTTNSSTLGSDGAAVAIGGGHAIAIGNRMHNVLRGFEIEGQAVGDAKQEMVILGNVITGIWDGMDDGGYGIVIIGNSMAGAGNIAQITIEANLIDASPETSTWRTGGIVASGGEYLSIRNNTVRRCGSGIALFAGTTPMVRAMVSGNLVVGSVKYGIRIAGGAQCGAEGFLVSGNLVVDGAGNGIEVEGHMHSVVGNRVSGNRGVGIRLHAGTTCGTSAVFLDGNYCARNVDVGIQIEEEAEETILSHNALLQNGAGSYGFVTNLVDRSATTQRLGSY